MRSPPSPNARTSPGRCLFHRQPADRGGGTLPHLLDLPFRRCADRDRPHPGEAHARAIVRREALSPTVIDALVGLRHDRTKRRDAPENLEALVPRRPTPEMVGDEAERNAREELLRSRIKALAGHVARPAEDRLGLRNLSPIQEALLVRFARNRETGLFATSLADTLSASHWLAERIMLDISGQQLATTLKGLAMATEDALFILQRLYDHLGFEQNGATRAAALWDALDEAECGNRVEAWRRADSYTYSEPQHQPMFAENREEDSRQPRVIRTTASARKPLNGLYRAR